MHVPTDSASYSTLTAGDCEKDIQQKGNSIYTNVNAVIYEND